MKGIQGKLVLWSMLIMASGAGGSSTSPLENHDSNAVLEDLQEEKSQELKEVPADDKDTLSLMTRMHSILDAGIQQDNSITAERKTSERTANLCFTNADDDPSNGGAYCATVSGSTSSSPVQLYRSNQWLIGMTASCNDNSLYWVTGGHQQVYAGKIDGSRSTVLYSSSFFSDSVSGVAVNEDLGKLILGGRRYLLLVNSDGSSHEPVVLDDVGSQGNLPAVTIDRRDGKVYYGGRDHHGNTVIKVISPPYKNQTPFNLCSLDGSYYSYPRDMAVDPVRNRILWVDSHYVYSADMAVSGGNVQVIYANAQFGGVVRTIDFYLNHLYIGVIKDDGTDDAEIWKASAGGGGLVDKLISVESKNGIRGLVIQSCPSQSPSPTPKPTSEPSFHPTAKPYPSPTRKPTQKPTPKPTSKKTPKPTHRPTPMPTNHPTPKPTNRPTKRPTPKPTNRPTKRPTPKPTNRPTKRPTPKPTNRPTNRPTPKPTNRRTPKPTMRKPTYKPTPKPVKPPTNHPTSTPYIQPTHKPTLVTHPPSYEYHPKLYFTNGHDDSSVGGAYCATVTGSTSSSPVQLYRSNQWLIGMTASCNDNSLYWVTGSHKQVYAGKIDGSRSTVLYSSSFFSDSVSGVAVNEDLGKLILGGRRYLLLVNSDGYSHEPVVLDDVGSQGNLPAVTIDPRDGKVYYGGRDHHGNTVIKVISPPYKNQTPINLCHLSGADNAYPRDITVDLVRNSLVWVDSHDVYKASIDRYLNVQLLYQGNQFALDDCSVRTLDYYEDDLFIGIITGGTSEIWKAKASGSDDLSKLYSVESKHGIRGLSVKSCSSRTPKPSAQPTPVPSKRPTNPTPKTTATPTRKPSSQPVSVPSCPQPNGEPIVHLISPIDDYVLVNHVTFKFSVGWEANQISSVNFYLRKFSGGWKDVIPGMDISGNNVYGTYEYSQNLDTDSYYAWRVEVVPRSDQPCLEPYRTSPHVFYVNAP